MLRYRFGFFQGFVVVRLFFLVNFPCGVIAQTVRCGAFRNCRESAFGDFVAVIFGFRRESSNRLWSTRSFTDTSFCKFYETCSGSDAEPVGCLAGCDYIAVHVSGRPSAVGVPRRKSARSDLREESTTTLRLSRPLTRMFIKFRIFRRTGKITRYFYAFGNETSPEKGRKPSRLNIGYLVSRTPPPLPQCPARSVSLAGTVFRSDLPPSSLA